MKEGQLPFVFGSSAQFVRQFAPHSHWKKLRPNNPHHRCAWWKSTSAPVTYLVIKTQLSSLEVHITVALQNATRIIIIIKKQPCISAIFVDQQMDLQYPKLINKNTQGPGHVVDWSESSKFIWQWCWQPSLCEEDMKRNARKEKNLFFLASKLNSHSMLQLSLFPALHKQASNQFHLYLQEERERERESMREWLRIQQTTKSHLQLPFSPLHIPQKSKSPSPEENGRSNIHACTPKKENERSNRKKSSKKHEMCCGVFHQKIQNIPTATKNNRDILEITKFKVRIWH